MKCKGLLNVVKNHHWRSLFFQLWKYIIIAVGVPTVIYSIGFSGFYINKTYDEYENAFASSVYKSAENFKTNTEELFRSSIEFSQEKKFLSLLEENTGAADNIYEMIQYVEVKNLLQKYMYEYDVVENVWIYLPKNDRVISCGRRFAVDEELEKEIAYDCIRKDEKCSISKREFAISREEGEVDFTGITIAFPIKVENFNNADGVIVFNIACDNVSNKILYTKREEKENTAILTKNGTVISLGNDDTAKPEKLSFDKILKNTGENGYAIEKSGSDTYYCVPDTDFGFILLFSSGSQNMKKLTEMVIEMVMLLFLIALISTIILSYIISVITFNFMIGFAYGVGTYNASDEHAMVDYRYIGKRFLINMKKDAKIDEEFAVNMCRLRDMQVLALQNQINPHFIFNTLNFVNLMIIRLTKKDCAPAKVVSLLSDILQYSLVSEGFIATLSEELGCAHKYIEIEMLKHDNSFKMITNVDNKLLAGKCVKFSLQPILENCIRHGFTGEKNENGVIALSICRKGDNVCIVIKNSGICASEEKIREINESFKNIDTIKSGRHIGLANVNQRLKIIFGTSASMRVYNEQNGFAVEIIYPFEI